MEYALLPQDEYEHCQMIASSILKLASRQSRKSIENLRASQIINYLNKRFEPKLIGFYSLSQDIKKQFRSNCLAYYNQQFDIHNIYMHARELIEVADVFTETVSGMTTFSGNSITLFLNANNTFERTMFTALHEFAHMYQAEKSPDYLEEVALINEDRMQGQSYPPELQPIEDEANAIASLLLIPDDSLRFDLQKLGFYQLKDKYGISTTALFNRLRSYFYYNTDFDEYESNQAAQAFSINDHKLIYHVRSKIN